MTAADAVSTAAYECASCGFDLWLPIASLSVSVLGFYDDARFPGRCILAFRDHAEELTELDDDAASAFMADARTAARAIHEATRCDRLNYAILGNTLPHLHWHLIPRTREGDPIPTRPPWEHPEPQTKLAASETERLVAAIRSQL